MPKVELAFDIWEDGFLRVKGQVVEYDERLTTKKIEQGHFLRHPDTPSRINPDLYGLGCVPSGPSIMGNPGPELVNIPAQKFKNTHSGLLNAVQDKQSVFAEIALEIAKNEPKYDGTISDTLK